MKPEILKLLKSTNVEDISIGLNILYYDNKEEFIRYCSSTPYLNSKRIFFVLGDLTYYTNLQNNLVPRQVSEEAINLLRSMDTEIIINE